MGVGAFSCADLQFEQLVGVTRPGLAMPSQPQRPMTKVERTKFRRELQEQRGALVAAKREAVLAEVQAMDADALVATVREAETELHGA